MTHWNGTESGILRKTTPIENHDELLVFGYACKLFRDDEKALYIDQGKHLIPWMGDKSLMIDRYDCRGHLSDLSKFEASREGFDAMRWLGLSEKERHLEELCDKERYYSLEINEEEEEMYKEEEQKRQKTTAISYSYDVPVKEGPKPENDGIPTVAPLEETEETYIPPPSLDVPVDIEIPKTVKENARIEKTAMFVCKQGPQMEILIKAKQGDNPQFSFLNQSDKLYKFYRHVLTAFKSGIYQGYKSNSEQKTELEAHHQQESSSHYLHPSLLSTAQQLEPQTTVPQVAYKPSVNCAYSQLVNRIQGNQTDGQEAVKVTEQPLENFSQLSIEQQQYYHYYYAQQYYEYYKQMALYQQGQGGNPGQFVPSADFQNLDPSIKAYIQQMAYAQYMQHLQQPSTNNSYAQIVSNVNKDNPYMANVPQLPHNVIQQEEVRNSPVVEEPKSETPPEVVIKKPLLSLAAYGSGSDSESEKSSEEIETRKTYQVPTGEKQIVIDKMAMYVSKNGEQFEDIVKAKSDPRFDFLNEDHEYNTYYKEKIKELKGESKKENENEKKDVKTSKKEKKVIAPVSFSIKKAKDEHAKEIKSALPVEESDDDETREANQTPATNTPLVTTLIKYTESNAKKPQKETKTIVKKEDTLLNKKHNENPIVEKKSEILDSDDPILEMIELTDSTEDKKDIKRAEDRIKDKLAAAAREKLALASRDRALQLERKKKAAAFLRLKSAETKLPQQPDIIEIGTKTPPSRRESIEIIDLVEPSKKHRSASIDKDRSISIEDSESGSESHERKREEVKERKRRKHRKRSKRSSTEDEPENKRLKDEDRRERKKKTHRRKHSKTKHERTKKKSRKHRKRSSTESSASADSS